MKIFYKKIKDKLQEIVKKYKKNQMAAVGL